jgi:hypothetical protein
LVRKTTCFRAFLSVDIISSSSTQIEGVIYPQNLSDFLKIVMVCDWRAKMDV